MSLSTDTNQHLARVRRLSDNFPIIKINKRTHMELIRQDFWLHLDINDKRQKKWENLFLFTR